MVSVRSQRRGQHLGVLAAHLRRQVVELDPFRFGEGDRALDDPFELANVAGPAVEPQRVLRAVGQRQLADVAVAGEEVAGQFADVVAPRSRSGGTWISTPLNR